MYHQKGNLKRDILNNSKLYELIDSGTRRLSMIPHGISKQYNAMYDEDNFHDAMIGTALHDTNISSYVGRRRRAVGIPSDEWFRLLLSNTDCDSAEKLFTDVVLDQVNCLYKQGHIPKKGMCVAIDIHDISRYDKEYGDELARGKSKNGTKLFERYITVQCVAGNVRQVIAALPMKALQTAAQFVPKIMKIVKEIVKKIKIRCVMAGRGFFSVETLVALESMKLKYLIPCTNTSRVIETLREFAENKRDKTSKMELTSGTGESIEYTIKITERKKKKKKNAKKPEEKYIGFATNDFSISVNTYSSRWGIETGYRNIESARIRTRSKNQGARVFCFFYSILIYNEWQIAMLQCIVAGKNLVTLLQFLTEWFDKNHQSAEPPPVIAP